jgi:glucose/mannose-6-phosphate isomerase
MEKLIAQFPKHISDALVAARETVFHSLQDKQFDNVVVCGMGGSGIGGRLISQWFADTCAVPITLVQDYNVPGFVNEKSLVIGSSYSGNTEETIQAVQDAMAKKATIIGVSSGGELIRLCKDNGFEFSKVPGGNPPRSMLAFSIVHLINIFSQAKLIEADSLDAISRCRHLLNIELLSIKTSAKELAEFAYNKQLIIYSANQFEGVSVRLRQQFNENAKQLCWHHVIPEMNHNELVGWGGGNEHFAVVFISGNNNHPKLMRRFELTREIVERKTQHTYSLRAKGANILEETFFLIHIIDWASIYLAELNQQDPMEIKVIDYLKDQLEKLN